MRISAAILPGGASAARAATLPPPALLAPALLAATLLAAPQMAHAQAYQCAVPRQTPAIRPVAPDGPTRNLAAERYTLAASWSPEYCKSTRDTRSMQCSRTHGRFGFILHGLWPESTRGPSPQWCAGATTPPVSTVRPYLCMTPSADLLAREWAKHGSCMTRTPDKYFKVSSILWRSIRWPDADRLSRKKDLTAGDLRDEFLAANRGWRRDAIAVDLSSRGWLREVRLCYGKDFRPAACPRGRSGARDSTEIRIWRGL